MRQTCLPPAGAIFEGDGRTSIWRFRKLCGCRLLLVSHQDMDLVLLAAAGYWNFVAGQNLAVQDHLFDSPVNAIRVIHTDVVTRCTDAVSDLKTGPMPGNTRIDL